MKKFTTILFLMTLINFSSVSYGAEINYQGKIGGNLRLNGSAASDVAKKANQNYDYTYNGVVSDPMMNGMMNGMYNAMQGATGTTYSVQEMQKQQMDYAKQQNQYFQQMEAEEK